MATWKEKYNKKYDYPKSESHSLSEISKDTGVSKKGLQQIYNKGIGAYKTNPQSVRPTVTSKEQWAMARVYSSVMGGKASKVDAKELKMEMGGKTEKINWSEYYEEGGLTETSMSKEMQKRLFDDNGERKIDRESIKVLTDYVNSLPQTKSMYFNESTKKYSPSRQKIHREILQEFKDELVCIESDEPIAILMGGSPASGKSTFLRKYAPYLLSEELLRIDADEVRSQLPEYEGWNASQTHLETKDIVNTLLSDRTIGLPCKFDLIYDGTMNNTKSYIPLIKLLRKLGYKIYVVYIDNVPKDVIEKRALERYGKSGRFVPLEVIDDFFSKGKTALNQIKKLVDGYMVVDGGSNDYRIIEEGGFKLPRNRAYSQIGYPTKELERADFYKGYYERLSPSNFDVKQKGGKIQIDVPMATSHDGIDEVDAIANGMFKKGGETDFNPDGKIKDKIVHASGEAGGMLVGKRHSNGGIKALNKSTGQPLEMEGGEVVITRDAVSDNKKRSFNGKMMTNRQILSAINESGGGVSFADGGQVPNDVQFDCNAEYEYGGKTMCGKDLAYALGGVTTAIVTDPNEAMADLQSTYGFGDVYAKGGEVNEAYVDFMNKDKGFKADRKYFKTYEDAEKWARNEFEKFYPDMIGYTEYERPLTNYDKGGTIECGSCDWSWDRKDGGDDMYVCHKCGTDNTEKYNDAELFDDAREQLGKEYLENLDKFAKGGLLTLDEFPANLDEATFVKDLGGSTGAKLYEYKGKRFVIKAGASEGQSVDEFLANQVYHILDIPVPRSILLASGEVVKEFIGKEADVDYDNHIDLKLIARGFVADALLGNWDIYKNDNIILKEGTRTPFRIDSGGSLRYRARGQKKDNFGREVTELKTLIENNPKIKSYITDSVLRKGIEKVLEKKSDILSEILSPDLKGVLGDRISYLEGVLNEINDRRGTDFVDEEVEVKADVVETKETSFEEKFLENKISQLRKAFNIKKRFLSEIDKGIALRNIRKYEIALDEIRLESRSFEEMINDFAIGQSIEFGDIDANRTLRKQKSINGEPSQLTKREYDSVRSESFIDWFGDWELAVETGNYEGVSKIINSQTKEPLVVYHGTDTKFTQWDTYEKNNLHYFAKKKSFADWFAKSWTVRGDDAGVQSAEIKKDNPLKGTFVYACFLDIKNPIDFTPFGVDKVPFKDYLKYLEVKYDLDLSKIEGYDDVKDRTQSVYSWVVIRHWQQFNLFIKNNTPYDGFSFYEFIPETSKRGFEDASLSFTAFNSNQIKFANNRTFSKFAEDSRLEVGGIIF